MSSGASHAHSARPALPDFANPPVNEVVLGVQFAPLAGLQTAHLGLLWSRFRSQFPAVEQEPPLAPQNPEDLTGAPRPVGVQIEMSSQFPLPRLRFVSESENELLQVQNDRFIANWRRVRGGDVYPRYEHVRGYFQAGFSEFLAFVDEEGLGPVEVRQCEVIYLNQLVLGDGWSDLGDVSQVLSFWGEEMSDDALPPPEAASVALQFLLREEGEARGRLYVDVRPSIRLEDRHPLLAMNLTARMPLSGDGLESVLDATDFGRSWIVRAFASLTTPHMHEIWERRDVDA